MMLFRERKSTRQLAWRTVAGRVIRQQQLQQQEWTVQTSSEKGRRPRAPYNMV